MSQVINCWHVDPDVYQKAVQQLNAGNSYTKSSQAPYILLSGGDIDKKRVIELFKRSPIPGYEVAKVEVIFNKTLVQGFEAKIKALEQRYGNEAFDPRWKKETEDPVLKTLRERINYALTNEVAKYAVPNRHVKLLPMLHGTSTKLFDSIFRTGFDNLASTDVGYFGKGIYNTSYADYAWRVYSTGGLIFNWVAFYSAFPVIRDDMKKLVGSNKHQNYDAHFTLVKPINPDNIDEKVYVPIIHGDEPTYNELVVFESPQVLPRYVVTLEAVGLNLKEVAPKATKQSLIKAMSALWKKVQPVFQDSLTKKIKEIQEAKDDSPLTKEEEWLQGHIEEINANEDHKDQYIPKILKEQVDKVLKIGSTAKVVEKASQQSPPTAKKPAVAPMTVASTAPSIAPDQENTLDRLYKMGLQLSNENKQGEAFKVWEQAADRGHALSQYQVSQCYKQGLGCERDYKVSIEYAKKAAVQKHPDALDYIGHCYFNGLTLPKNPQQAVTYFREAAALGNISSMQYMALCHTDGLGGCNQDPKEILRYWKMAANAGNAHAQWMVSQISKQAKLFQDAFDYALKAADNPVNSIADAQDYVGHCFLNGLSTPTQPEKAVIYFNKARAQGSVSSTEYLGICAADGKGMPKDDIAAFKFFLEAADKGRPYSQYQVGMFFRDGRGTTKNPDKAEYYIQLAAQQGYKPTT